MGELSRDEWIKQRMSYIGASEVPAILGIDPRRGQLSVYNTKVQGYTMKDNMVLRHGRLMEDPIAIMFSDLSGRKVINPGATLFQRHPNIPWLGSTLDRIAYGSDEYPAIADGPSAVEIKNIDIPGLTEESWNTNNEDIFSFVVQNQVQAWCTDYKWCTCVGKFPFYSVTWFDHLRDDEFLRSIYPTLEKFWDRVQRRDPPPPDELPGTLKVCKRVWPKDNGGTVVLDDDWTKIVDNWEKAKHLAKTNAKKSKVLEAKILGEIRENSFGKLSDGTYLSNRANKAGTRTLKRFTPKGR